ncbi:hypothetical protein QP726_00270 [Micrococcus luteus]|nr:hypothetical protein [Micrococcus luteus]MDK8176812.1 hypothetical protein [Micrococcus luteus]
MLRIYPAYWVVLAVTGLVFAPLAALLGSGSTSVAAGLDYLVQNSTLWLRRYGVGHTLVDVPEQRLWNGSLWTLMFEFGAYLAAMVLLGAALVRRHLTATLAVLLVLITAAGLTGLGSGIQLPMDLLNQGIRLGGCFVAGMFVYSVRFRLPVAWPLALASLVITVWLVALPDLGLLAALPLAVALLSLGALLPTRVGAVNDISYGVYIYAFPVQQLLVVVAGTGWPVWLHALAALGLTAAAAWLSWLLVERPALRLAHRSRPHRSA